MPHLPEQLPVIGLFPAAGFARRLVDSKLSKEILPVIELPSARTSKRQLSDHYPVGHYLLRSYLNAGISKVLVILRSGKWDIPDSLSRIDAALSELSYIVVNPTPSTVHTIDKSYQHIRSAIVAFGFPDIIVQPDDVYQRLLPSLMNTRADVVLALFPSAQPEKFDMVATSKSGYVTNIEIKNQDCKFENAWVCAVWKPSFTEFLHRWTRQWKRTTEPFLGNAMQAAISHGMQINSVKFSHGKVLDIGTTDDLALAQNRSRLEEFFKIHVGI